MATLKEESITIPKWFIRFVSVTGTMIIVVICAAVPWAYNVSNEVATMSHSIQQMLGDMKEDNVRERDDLMRITRLEEKVSHLERHNSQD